MKDKLPFSKFKRYGREHTKKLIWHHSRTDIVVKIIMAKEGSGENSKSMV